MKIIGISMIVLVALAMGSQAATVTWDYGDSTTVWETPENWAGDVAPTSGVDSVVLDLSLSQVYLTSEYTVGSGQTLVNSAAGTMRLGSGGNLTVASGGTLNLLNSGNGILAQSGTTGQRFTMEPAASATFCNVIASV